MTVLFEIYDHLLKDTDLTFDANLQTGLLILNQVNRNNFYTELQKQNGELYINNLKMFLFQ